MKHIFYLTIIFSLLGFNAAVLDVYAVPKDCSVAATAAGMNGYLRGLRYRGQQ